MPTTEPSPAIAFRPVEQADYPVLAGWLAQEHVRAWWGEPMEELALIRQAVEGTDATRCFITTVGGEAVGFVQCWRPRDYRQPQWLEDEPWLADVPADTLGIDILIGEAARAGRGLGSTIVRAFAQALFDEGVPRLIIDPDEANERAVRAYEKAGFRRFDRHEDADGATVLMEMLAPASPAKVDKSTP